MLTYCKLDPWEQTSLKFESKHTNSLSRKCIWVRSWNCCCLVTWFCYQLIAKPGNKTATVSWPDAQTFCQENVFDNVICKISAILFWPQCVNTLRPRRNEQHFADDIFKRIFFTKNVWISIKISLKFVPKGPINNIPGLVQIMAWRRSGDKPLSEPMMVSLPTHICVTRPQWVKSHE